ncbi:hypothetical protein GCM10028791_37620 [Echinicola sediminis]
MDNQTNTLEKITVEIKEGLNLLQGEQAKNLLSNPSFQEAWDLFYDSCPWATVFQHRKFVTTWYKHYEHDFAPLVIYQQSKGKISGILTMAIPKDHQHKKRGVRIIGAGQYDAEYQTWLSLDPEDTSFIEDTIKALLQKYPNCKIVFRYLPPKTPLDWVNEGFWKNKCVLQASSRPLMDTNHKEFQQLLRKRHLKAKFNRFSKAGSLELKHVLDYSYFSHLLETLEDQYDFRQGALFNKNQFRDDPHKSPFLKALFQEGLLHVTALIFEKEIVAVIVSVEGKKWVHLAGLITHSPFYSKYSPGLVQLFMLGKKFDLDDVDVFDLTPGNDPYKERVATNHDTIHELVITQSTSYKWKRACRKKFFDYLLKSGQNPQKLQLQLTKLSYQFKQKSKHGSAVKALVSLIKSDKKNNKQPATFSSICPKAAKGDYTFSINNLRDLLHYEQRGSDLTRWEFLENALQLFEKEQVSFSLAKDKDLLFCAWIERPNGTSTEYKGETVQIPEASAIISYYYCHPSLPEKSVLEDLSKAIMEQYPAQRVLIGNQLSN